LDALAPGSARRRAPHDRRRPAHHAGAAVVDTQAHRRAVAATSGHAPLILGQDGEPVRTERVAARPLHDRARRDELAAYDLLGLQPERAVVPGPVDNAVDVGALVGPAKREQLAETRHRAAA